MRYRRLAVFLVTSLLGAGSGCSAVPKAPEYMDRPSIHPKYGGEAYLQGVGISQESQAAAELSAKAAVSAQIVSRIRATTEDYTRSVRERGSETVYAEFKQLVATDTDFSRAELIRVDTASNAHIGRNYYAFAYLGKADLRKALLGDLDRDTSLFRADAAAANRAYATGDVLDFAVSYRRAGAAFASLENDARILFALDRGECAVQKENRKTFIELAKEAQDLRTRLHFFLVFNGPRSEIGRERLSAMFQDFFQRAGLAASVCDACPCLAPYGFRFEAEASETNQTGMLGPVCALDLKARVVGCGESRSILNLELDEKVIKGTHSVESGKAIEKLYERLDQERLYRVFLSSMQAYFPVD